MESTETTQVPQVKLLIDGAWKSSTAGSSNVFGVHHPQTREMVCTAVSASSNDVQEAIAAAARAFPLWESTPPSVRRRILLKAADILDTPEYRSRIKEWTCRETGATDIWGHYNTNSSVPMREAASLASQIRGETVNSETPGVTFIVQRRAIGVILAITPWNAPGPLSVRAIAIPLICGNTVILKSSEISPMTTSIIVEALHEAGMPRGVINYLNMSRETAPKLTSEIIAHPAVRKLNFTGSDNVGKILAAEAAKHLKPCVFELGGKAPCVVLNDADVEDAARAIVSGAMLHSGQICMSTERVIVQKGVAQKLISAVSGLVTKLKTGLAATPGPTQVGSLFSPIHAENFISLLEDAKSAGAEVVVGDLKKDGAVVGPHILKGVKPGMKIWERESFGPVVGFIAFETVDEAIELANSSDYSLTASLWTKNIDGINIAGRIRAGTVIINGNTLNSEPSFGNYGLGGATGYGRFDVEHWTDLRAIVIRPGREKNPFLGD